MTKNLENENLEDKINDQARAELEKYVSENGIKMQFIAKAVGIPLSTLSKWRHRKMRFRVDKIIRILKYIRD